MGLSLYRSLRLMDCIDDCVGGEVVEVLNSLRQSLFLNPDEIHDGISFLRASPGTEALAGHILPLKDRRGSTPHHK